MVRIYIVGIIALLFVSCSDFLKEYSQDLAYVNSYTDLDELLPGGAYLESDFSSFLYTGHTLSLIHIWIIPSFLKWKTLRRLPI